MVKRNQVAEVERVIDELSDRMEIADVRKLASRLAGVGETTQWLTATEAADKFGVTASAIYHADRAGRLTHEKRYGRLVYHVGDLRVEFEM